MSADPASFPPQQLSLDELPEALSETTFVVVDLETTGSRPQEAGITEIGAVKLRGADDVAEFATLVHPRHPIPPFITLLTGITEAMVSTAPPVEAVLPAFLEFARDHVLVAHNAAFDVGFLKAVCAQHGFDWPSPPILDTVSLARQLFPRSEVRNHKLGTLAQHLGLEQQPRHRALDDARATAGVLRAAMERAQGQGVTTLPELRSLSASPASAAQRRARSRVDLDGIPALPGVYVFEDAHGQALYIGKSANIRSRVASYFTGSEKRRHIRQMLDLAHRVRPIVCPTALEAEVRELRLIAEHTPHYNRRPRKPGQFVWLRIAPEREPSPSALRIERCANPVPAGTAGPAPACLGPFSSVREAELARAALRQALGSVALRPTSGPASTPRPQEPTTAELLEGAMHRDTEMVRTPLTRRIESLAAQQRYEEAGQVRDRLSAYLRGARRQQRLTALASCSHLVAARRTRPYGEPTAEEHRWELAVVRSGRLAASGVLPPEADPQAYLRATVATAETVSGGPGPTPAASATEMEAVLAWLEQPGTRLVELTGTWACPIDGAERYRDLTDWHRGEYPAQ
ncbi:DEDD exonuclease domain-containing protein [Lipingzhangella sp. LS1_29]|uniref:DEDD exonuclease domain-containing protein n=1 Tax=Lipingzhangella rawalii TaxID=2055835 RepID=A0ABU2H051_9ACTN|nr:DEDD exonuclease domain-containing protein [Lipingzhangella rawalii]